MNVSIWEKLLRKVKPRTFHIYFSFTILQLSLSTVILTEIAFGFCPFDASSGFAPMRPDYKESCREVAYGICRGVVGDKVEDLPAAESIPAGLHRRVPPLVAGVAESFLHGFALGGGVRLLKGSSALDRWRLGMLIVEATGS